MNWRKVWVVARHEYLTNIRRTGFIIMTAIVPAMGLLALLFGAFFSGQARQLGAFLERQFDTGGKRIGVVDRSGRFSPLLPEYQEDFVLYEGMEEARAALEANEVQMILEIGEDYVETGRV
ncbi:MAG TPA: hypothetical protein ENK56_03020, partial [Chloroflexi bacterium]|nr:hypothetical protein [Chloroflexota bacterium]